MSNERTAQAENESLACVPEPQVAGGETEKAEPTPASTAAEGAPGGPPSEAGSATPVDHQARAEENWQRYLRAAADLENYRKRSAREKQDAIRFTHEALLAKLLPVLDNLDMALAAVNNAQGTTVDALKTGVTMIASQLRSVLAEAGLEEIDATGQAFDPNLHEAVSQQESASVPEGQVVQQMRKGYRHRGRLLRPATVIVARPPSEGPAANT